MCIRDRLSINDNIDFNILDMIYIGSGSEEKTILALNHLMQYSKQIKDAFDSGKFFLITGNAIEMFGKYIIDLSDIKTKALGILDYYAVHGKRTVGDVCLKTEFSDEKIIGFVNHQGALYINEEKIDRHFIYENNFLATYVLGPLLARNPHLTKKIIKRLLLYKDSEYSIKPFDIDIEEKAYVEFINAKNYASNI